MNLIEVVAETLGKNRINYTEDDGHLVETGVVGVVYPMNGGRPGIILTDSDRNSWVLSLERFATTDYV